MTDLCAIQGQLVDVRNVGTHKCVKLTIHVPAEYAPRVFEAFGWPTGVDPVPVALARLNTNGKEANAPTVANPAPDPDPPVRAPRKLVMPENRLTRTAAILCTDPVFQAFLFEHDMIDVRSEEKARLAVHFICNVQSRKEIIPGTPAGDEWQELYSKFMAWKIAA